MQRESIDHIGLDRLEVENDAGANESKADVRYYPLHMLLGAPSEEKQANGKENSSWDHSG